MPRPRPVSVGEIKPGHVSYVDPMFILPWAESQPHAFAVTAERLDDNEASVTVPLCAWTMADGTLVKSRDPFTHHREDGAFWTLLSDCAEARIFGPGSYPAIFRESYQSPRTKRLYNSWLRFGFAGGWEDCYVKGWVKGPLWCYDLTSAYLWAATVEGLPVPDAIRIVKRLPSTHGLALIRAIPTEDRVPCPWVPGERCLGVVLPGDIERYGLKGIETYLALQWDPSAQVVDGIAAALHRVPSCFDILRKIFWGVWAPTGPAQTVAFTQGRVSNRWDAPDRWSNLVWASLIVGKVKQRIWAASTRAVEIFVDSVLTRERLQESEGLGGWRCVGYYPDGLYVRGPRQWQTRNRRWVKHAGIDTATLEPGAVAPRSEGVSHGQDDKERGIGSGPSA